MTPATFNSANELMQEIQNIPAQKQLDYINLMRAMVLGARVTEQAYAKQTRSAERREGA